MADKSSFIIHLTTAPQWRMLSDTQAGILIKALIAYAETGEQLDSDDGMLMMAFSFITCQIDSDSEKYSARCEQNRKIAEDRERKKREKHGKGVNDIPCEENDERARTCTNVHERAQTCTNATDNDNDNDIDNDFDIESDTTRDAREAHTRTQRGSSFEPPTVEEVQAYCQERGNGIDAQRFVDYHASLGWIVGGSMVRDWKALVRKWESTQTQSKPPERSHESSSIDMSMLEKIMNPYAIHDDG